MPVYAWKGLNNAGKAVTGTKDADGPKGLRQTLRKDGVFVTEHREVLGGGARARRAAKATLASGEKVPFFKREIDLGGLLERVRPQDVAVLHAPAGDAAQGGHPAGRGAGRRWPSRPTTRSSRWCWPGSAQKVNEGTSLADTLAAHPNIFPELYINMVRSGEAAGNLDAVLLRLADFMDAQNALRAKVSGALTYPIIMMVLGAIVMGVLMVVVVPKITSVFEDLGKTLPWNTQLLIFVSDVVGSYWWAADRRSAASPTSGYQALGRASRRGAHVVDRLKLRLPLIGPLVRYVGVARFARTLATMLAAGVPVLTRAGDRQEGPQQRRAREGGRGGARRHPRGRIDRGAAQAVGPVPVDDGAHGRGRRALGPARGHAGERRRRLRARRRGEGRAADDGSVAAASSSCMALVVVFIVFSVLQPILDMQNFVQ